MIHATVRSKLLFAATLLSLKKVIRSVLMLMIFSFLNTIFMIFFIFSIFKYVYLYQANLYLSKFEIDKNKDENIHK